MNIPVKNGICGCNSYGMPVTAQWWPLMVTQLQRQHRQLPNLAFFKAEMMQIFDVATRDRAGNVLWEKIGARVTLFPFFQRYLIHVLPLTELCFHENSSGRHWNSVLRRLNALPLTGNSMSRKPDGTGILSFHYFFTGNIQKTENRLIIQLHTKKTPAFSSSMELWNR